ncbi:PREDICTED: LOW QUALITY PROTEIN: uncharacterized protein LOC109487527 [Branchiostoma belcheri]|uniref:LOW QUALITY PROTEIN: uncharacterized protein LOC109487527 n=1 Tax=Branchiostoma belcheri TaxID=7741 RepID=A0A6P5ABS8_BRABE|nr:PREDICTED: LOW QUALITY PROTEIN: uncharacterized protein LOC109487527 [Branchiostoma belcheri]
MAMSRGHLAAGKQRLKEKLKTIDELKTRVLQYITNLTEEPTEAALQLLEETDRGRFFGQFSSVSQDLEKCLDTLFLLCVSLNNDEDACDGPVSELSSSESSESSVGAVKPPCLPGRTEVSPEAVSKHTGRKKHHTERKKMAPENESGISSIQIDSESNSPPEVTCKEADAVTGLSPLHESGRSLSVQTNDAMSEEEIDKENHHPILSSPPSQTGVDILRDERTRNKSSHTSSSPTQHSFSSQLPQVDIDGLKERRTKEDVCPTIAGPHGLGDQLLTNREEKMKQEETLAIQSLPDEADSCGLPTDCTVIQEQGIGVELARKDKESVTKCEAPSGDCNDVENEGQEKLEDLQMLSKEVEAPDQRQDDSSVWVNNCRVDVDGTNVPGEPSAILPSSRQNPDCRASAKQQQEHRQRVLCTGPGVGMETHPPVTRKLLFNGEEIPLPSDTESELSSYSPSHPNTLNVSRSSEDCSTKDTSFSSPHKETSRSTTKPSSIDMEGNDDFDIQPQVCKNRKTEEEEANESQLAALDHLTVQGDLDEVHLTGEVKAGDGRTAERVCATSSRMVGTVSVAQTLELDYLTVQNNLEEVHVTGDGRTAKIVCATSGGNELVGTVSVASSTEDLEEMIAVQRSLKYAGLIPAPSCHGEEKSCQSAEESSLSPANTQQSSLSSVLPDPLCHSSPVRTNPPSQDHPSEATETFSPGYENRAEVKPHRTDPNSEEEVNMPVPRNPPGNTEGSHIRTKSSSDNTASEQDYYSNRVSTDHSHVPSPPMPVPRNPPGNTEGNQNIRTKLSSDNTASEQDYYSNRVSTDHSQENVQTTQRMNRTTSGNTAREQDYYSNRVSTDHSQENVPCPPKCQSSPHMIQQPLTVHVQNVGTERLFPTTDYSEPHLHREEGEQNTSSTSLVNATETPTVASVPSCQAGHPVRVNPPVQQPVSTTPMLQNNSGQASMQHYHCPQVQLPQVKIPQVQGPQVQGPRVPSLTFSDGDSLDVVVSDIINPSHFWIQPAGNQLNLLTEQLSLFYEKSTLPPGLPYTPAVGMFCAACFTQDNTWYRGRITAVHNVERTGIAELLSPSSSLAPRPVMFRAPQIDVDILYVDYGNRERLSMSRIKELHQQFTRLPCQALCCGLAKVMPGNGSRSWTSQQAVWFARQVLGKKLQAVIDLDPSRHATEVELFYTVPHDPQGQGSAGRVSISELMVTEKMAVERMPLHSLVEGVSSEAVQSGNFVGQTPRSPTVSRPPHQRILNHDKMLQDQARVQQLLLQQQEELQLRRQRNGRPIRTGSVADDKKQAPQKQQKDVNNTGRHGTQNSSKPPTDKSAPSEEKPKKNEKSGSKAPTAMHDSEDKVVEKMDTKGGRVANSEDPQKDWRLETADSSIDDYLDSLAMVPQPAGDGQHVTSSDKEHSSGVKRDQQPDNSETEIVKANSSERGSQTTKRCESSSGDIISPQWKKQIKKLSSGNGSLRKPKKRGGAGKGRGTKMFSSSGSTTSEDDDRNWWRNDRGQKQKSPQDKKIMSNHEQKEGKKDRENGGMSNHEQKEGKKDKEKGGMSNHEQKGEKKDRENGGMGNHEQKEEKKDRDKDGSSKDADAVTVVDEGDSAQMKKPVVNLHDDGSFLLMTSYIVDPSEFYVHPVTRDAAKIDHLMKELNAFYQEKMDMLRHITFEPCVNDICCARFSGDKTWYRAQICTVTYRRDCSSSSESASGKKQHGKPEAEGLDCCEVQVFYLDYGNFETLPVSEVLPLMPEFTVVPAHAMKCSLYGIMPVSKTGKESSPKPAWSRKAAKAFADLTPFDKALVGYVKEHKPGSEVQPPLQLVLVDTSGSVDMCINDELVSAGVAEMCLPDTPPTTKTSKTKDDASLADDLNGLDEWDPRASDYLSERNSYFVDVDNAEVATTGYKSREIPVCKFFRPGSQCWKGDNCSYQHLQDGESKAADGIDVDKPNPLDELSKEINEHYSKKVYGEREVGITWHWEEIVIAKYSQDSQFYRARITSVNTETQEVWVFYVDYGNKERVQETDIHPIEPRFCQLPFQAVECYLANIEPLPTDQGKPRWSQTARDVFFELTGGKVLIAHILSRGWNDTLYVALFDTSKESDSRIDYALVQAGFARRVNIYNEQSVQERMGAHREGLAPG